MANDTRSSRKSKDDESNSSKGRHTSGRESTTSGSGTTDSYGLRRSARETPSKKQVIPSPSTMRKSKRLEKRIRMPMTPLVKKKSERVEKQSSPSPLRRSERGKKQSSSSSSEIKKSDNSTGLSDMKRKKEKREKSVKQLTLEAREVSRTESHSPEQVEVKRKRLDRRTYKALFARQKKKAAAADLVEEPKLPDKLPQRDSTGSGSKNVEGVVFDSRERRGDELREEYQTPELANPSLEERSLGGDIDLGGGDKLLSYKRKRNAVEMESNDSAMGSSKHICTPNADFVSLSPPMCKRNSLSETSIACFQGQRVDHDSQKQELYSCNAKLNGELHDTFTPKDRVEVEASVTTGLAGKCRVEVEASVTTGLAGKCNKNTQQKESSVDIQMDGDQNTCVICKLGGKLLCCDGKGCKRSYHLWCLDPPLDYVPPGVWHCIWCVKKKIELGVYSVSDGIESIWDNREVEQSNVNGLQKHKEYFVKYKTLAHVHNQWLPESQLLLEAPLLVGKFNRKNQVTRWKQEWTMPHRLLKKRVLLFPRWHDEHQSRQAGDISDCHFEWLVKWCGLDYEHATWELESAPFLTSCEAQRLLTEYENRRKKAKEDKVPEKRKDSLIKLSKLPVGGSFGTDNNHLNSVNKLREYWHKGRNAVVFDDQDRITKVILFILSLQSDVCHPFLIVSASSALSLWEAEFLRLAASVNVVVYNGNRDIRSSIRTLEFYEEGDSIMFPVLLSPPEAIVEDLEELKCVGWEAIIVDGCHCSKIMTQFELHKMLATNWRLLFVSGQIKDTTTEYTNLLSLLETGGDTNSSGGFRIGSADNIGELKERLSQHIAYECKSDSSRFVEYWVPVQISNVQLEQYCATLLSNSTSLRSCSKNDSVGALRDILISTRKCTDHPFLVDSSLPTLMTANLQVVEYLDVGIKASGKLQLLDKMLLEIKNRGLRVIIIFQSIGGSGKDSIGDYLDDFLRQRFGPDSYERIDGGLVPSKKVAALNKFNNKETGRFVLLLENRACLPSIKLSAVDTIIIFDSDWNPLNDLRALQRISIDSQFERIKVFRLYSSCTVEERILVLAKENVTVDSNLQNISRSTSHMLLMWGASNLLNKLDEFHGRNAHVSCANISLEESLLINVVKEFMTLLPHQDKNMDTNNFSIILKVQQNGGTYSMNTSLLGELEVQLMDEELPHVFWSKLLEGRNPRWKYLSGSSQRNRKRVQYFDDSPKKPEVEADEVVKKRKKVSNNSTDPAPIKSGIGERKVVSGVKEGSSGTPPNTVSKSFPRSAVCVNDKLHASHASPLLGNDISIEPEVHLVESEERRKLRDAQKSLHLLLKPEISKLCEILQLSEDVKGMVGRLLEYIMDNHLVNRESVTILQAFQLSLCWIGASRLKHKIDHKESLALAKQHLNFCCKEEEVDFVYRKLRVLTEMFFDSTGALKVTGSPINPVSATNNAPDNLLHASFSQSTASKQQKVKLEIEESQECSNNRDLSQQGQAYEFKMAEKASLKNIKRIKKRCCKWMSDLLKKQQEEVKELNRIYDEETKRLEKEYRMELAFVRSIHGHNPSGIDRQKILDDTFAKKMEEHKRQMDTRLKNLKAVQLIARNKENERKTRLLDEVDPLAQVEFLGKVPLNESVHGVEHLQPPEQVRAHDGARNIISANLPTSEEQILDRCTLRLPDGEVPFEVPETALDEVVGGLPNRENYGVDAMTSDRQNSTGLNQHDGGRSINGDTLSTMQSLVESPLLEPVIVPAQGGPLPLNQGLQDEFSLLATSTRIQDSDAPTNEKQNTPQQVEVPVSHTVDGLPFDQSNDEAPVIEPDVQLQLSQPTEIPLACEKQNTPQGEVPPSQLGDAVPANQCNDEALVTEPVLLASRNEHQLSNEGHASSKNRPDLPSDCAFASGQSNHVAQVIEPAVQLEPSLCTDLPSSDHNQPDLPITSGIIQHLSNEGHTSSQNVQSSTRQLSVPTDLPSSGRNQPDLPSTCGIHQFSSEGHTPSQIVQASTLLVDNLVELSNQAISQPLTYVSLNPPVDTPVGGFESRLSDTRTMPIISDFNNRPIQTLSTVASRMPLPVYSDPLQNELDRIRKETDQTIKIHEDMKQRLTSDCEKEIEEIVAQIHRKYEAKLQEVEAAFLLKKTELDSNHNIAYMNKMLAEAFRSKCLDLRASGHRGMQQELPSNFAQQLVQPSLQQSAQRPPLVASQSSVGLPAASMQTTAPPRPSIVAGSPFVGPPAASPQTATPPRPPLVAGPSSVSLPAVSLQATTTPVHVRHSSALLSSIPTRPLHISPITPTTGNLRVGSEIRAPAPHLQPFRPSTSLSATTLPSLPRGMMSQQASSNPTVTSPSLHQLPTRPPPPPPPPPPYESGPSNRAPWPEIAGGLQALHNSSPSALELLREIYNRPGADPPNDLTPLPDLVTDFNQLDPFELGMPGSSRQVNSGHGGVASDVVYLSDDD